MRLSRNLVIGTLGCLSFAIAHTASIAQSIPAPMSNRSTLIATQLVQTKQAKPDAFYQKAKKSYLLTTTPSIGWLSV